MTRHSKKVRMDSLIIILILFLCVGGCENVSGVSSKLVGKWVLDQGFSLGLATPIEFKRSGAVIVGVGHPKGPNFEDEGTWKVVDDKQLHIELTGRKSEGIQHVLEIVSVTQDELVLKQGKDNILRYRRHK